MELLNQDIRNWFIENYEYGISLGYPDCCVKAFCANSPKLLQRIYNKENLTKRYNAGCIDNKFTGFIPCIKHAKQILNNEIKLTDLIKNRDPKHLPFPKVGQ